MPEEEVASHFSASVADTDFEDTDIRSAVTTLRNETLHISIKIFIPKGLFCFPPFQEILRYHITRLSNFTADISSDLAKVIKHSTESLGLAEEINSG